MEEFECYNVSIKMLKEYFNETDFIAHSDDFMMIGGKSHREHHMMKFPARFDGYFFLYCISGEIKINYNVVEYTLSSNSIFCALPNNILRIADQPSENLEYVAVAISEEFMSGLSVNVSKFFDGRVSIISSPILAMSPSQHSILRDYFNLLKNMVATDFKYKKDSINCLFSSMFYVLAESMVKQGEDDQKGMTARSRLTFEEFIRLVAEYHTKHRNVGFYADKLCLTPKYLSKLIKTVTGHSAPEWIDQYVILEAKNLLKYSKISIKEIVYKLNFPNQSVFYKFFKARTGMTPTQYRRS